MLEGLFSIILTRYASTLSKGPAPPHHHNRLYCPCQQAHALRRGITYTEDDYNKRTCFNTCHHTAATQLLQSYPVKCNHSTCLIEETTQTFCVPGTWRTRTTGQTHVVKHHTHTHTPRATDLPHLSVAEDGSRACVAVVGKKAVSSSFQMLQERRHRVKRSHIWASAWLSAVTGSPNISKCTIQAPEADASNKAGRKICGFPWA